MKYEGRLNDKYGQVGSGFLAGLFGAVQSAMVMQV
jgi:hypothetical protein